MGERRDEGGGDGRLGVHRLGGGAVGGGGGPPRRDGFVVSGERRARGETLGGRREGLPLVVVNPAFPFGERDIGPTPTGAFIVQALRGQISGYPDAGFCAVDVENVAEGHVLAAERGRPGERYILGEHNVTFADFF